MIKTISDLEKRLDQLQNLYVGWKDAEPNAAYMPKDHMLELMIRALVEYVKNSK